MVKTLFLGLDGATFTILDHLTSDVPGQGVVMPFLKDFMARGFSAKLRSTNHPLTPPAWVSLVTGRSPGNHGVFDFVRWEDRGDEFYFTLYDARDIRCETLWSILSRQDQSVVSLNFPMMAPPPPINGSLIPGFVSWKHLRRNMLPDTLYDRMKEIPDFNPRELAWDFERESQIGEVMSQAELEAWVEGHLPREAQWFKISETLLREDDPDLFAVMFDGTDKIQHQTWHVLDPNLAPQQPDDDYRRLRALVLEYFRQLDGYLARLVEVAGPEAQVFMASDHGFTGSDEVIRINRYLGELGYLTWRETGASEYDKRRADANFAYLDWTKTIAFCPTPSSNGIVIRVADAPGKPGIAPEDYNAFRAKLIEDLYALKDPVSGEAIIQNIMPRDEAFRGSCMNQAPDLTLVLRDFGFVSVRNVEPVVQPRPVTLGTHHPDGIFIAGGKGIGQGRAERMSIMDVTPILIHSVGLRVPEDFEGMVPDTLFTAEHQAARPVRVGPATVSLDAPTTDTADDMTEDDKQKVLDQLRALGYLED